VSELEVDVYWTGRPGAYKCISQHARNTCDIPGAKMWLCTETWYLNKQQVHEEVITPRGA
jgi:hypothetical protein